MEGGVELPHPNRDEILDHICLVWFGKEEVLYMPDLHLIMHISRCHFGSRNFVWSLLFFTTGLEGPGWSHFLSRTDLFKPCSPVLSQINRGSYRAGSLQPGRMMMMLNRALGRSAHGSMWTPLLTTRIHGLREWKKKMMGSNYHLQIWGLVEFLWIQFLSNLKWLHLLCHLLLRLQWHKPLGTLWARSTSLQPLGVFVVNKSWLRRKGRKALALFRWVLTMPATSPCQPISNRWALVRERGLLWCSTIVISAFSHHFKGGCLTRSWQMRMPGSMCCLTLVLWDLLPLDIIATFSWWRRSTTSSWSWQDPWPHTDLCRVAAGMRRLGQCYRMRLFSLSDGRSCEMTVQLGWMSKSSWKVSWWFTWSWEDTVRIRTCQSRSTMWRILSCGSYKKPRSFQLLWSPFSKDGECVPYPGKWVGGSTLSPKEGSWWRSTFLCAMWSCGSWQLLLRMLLVKMLIGWNSDSTVLRIVWM